MARKCTARYLDGTTVAVGDPVQLNSYVVEEVDRVNDIRLVGRHGTVDGLLPLGLVVVAIEGYRIAADPTNLTRTTAVEAS